MRWTFPSGQLQHCSVLLLGQEDCQNSNGTSYEMPTEMSGREARHDPAMSWSGTDVLPVLSRPTRQDCLAAISSHYSQLGSQHASSSVINPSGRQPLLSAKPAAIFPVKGPHCPLADTNHTTWWTQSSYIKVEWLGVEPTTS